MTDYLKKKWWLSD